MCKNIYLFIFVLGSTLVMWYTGNMQKLLVTLALINYVNC